MPCSAYVPTGLSDEMKDRLPEGSFPRAVFGDSLRYFKGLVGSLEAKHAFREVGVLKVLSGGGFMFPPERPAGARKVVAAPFRQGEGANRLFSRQHRQADHDRQWNMLKIS